MRPSTCPNRRPGRDAPHPAKHLELKTSSSASRERIAASVRPAGPAPQIPTSSSSASWCERPCFTDTHLSLQRKRHDLMLLFDALSRRALLEHNSGEWHGRFIRLDHIGVEQTRFHTPSCGCKNKPARGTHSPTAARVKYARCVRRFPLRCRWIPQAIGAWARSLHTLELEP